jgi:hypothetical protein
MSAATIKAALSTILTANVPSLKAIDVQYRRLTPSTKMPRATLYDLGYKESRQGIGLKQKLWRISTHIVMDAKAVDPTAEGATFDALVQQIAALYALKTNSNLQTLADTATSKVIKYAEEIDLDKPPPQMNRRLVRFQAIFTAHVLELLNA